MYTHTHILTHSHTHGGTRIVEDPLRIPGNLQKESSVHWIVPWCPLVPTVHLQRTRISENPSRASTSQIQFQIFSNSIHLELNWIVDVYVCVCVCVCVTAVGVLMDFWYPFRNMKHLGRSPSTSRCPVSLILIIIELNQRHYGCWCRYIVMPCGCVDL